MASQTITVTVVGTDTPRSTRADVGKATTGQSPRWA